MDRSEKNATTVLEETLRLQAYSTTSMLHFLWDGPYLLVDGETHLRVMEALQRQQDRDAIAEVLSQMESGQGKPLDEAFAEIRTRLAFPTLQ